MIMEENIKMDSNIKWVNEVKINRTLEALRKNNMESFLINTHEELINKIEELVDANSKVSFGGSMTLFESANAPFTISLMAETYALSSP